MAILRPGAIVPPATVRPTTVPTRPNMSIGPQIVPSRGALTMPTRSGRRFARGGNRFQP